MREIIYSRHLKERLELRELPYDLPLQIYERPTERYRDLATKLSVAIGKSAYRGRIREFAVVYRETEDVITLVTIHPVKPRQKLSRLRQGRWQPLP